MELFCLGVFVKELGTWDLKMWRTKFETRLGVFFFLNQENIWTKIKGYFKKKLKVQIKTKGFVEK